MFSSCHTPAGVAVTWCSRVSARCTSTASLGTPNAASASVSCSGAELPRWLRSGCGESFRMSLQDIAPHQRTASIKEPSSRPGGRAVSLSEPRTSPETWPVWGWLVVDLLLDDLRPLRGVSWDLRSRRRHPPFSGEDRTRAAYARAFAFPLRGWHGDPQGRQPHRLPEDTTGRPRQHPAHLMNNLPRASWGEVATPLREARQGKALARQVVMLRSQDGQAVERARQAPSETNVACPAPRSHCRWGLCSGVMPGHAGVPNFASAPLEPRRTRSVPGRGPGLAGHSLHLLLRECVRWVRTASRSAGVSAHYA
jgi:hypothetical protein